MSFAENLKRERINFRVTQHGLSMLSGINVNQISALEREVQLPSYKTIVDLCKALECEPNDLIEVK